MMVLQGNVLSDTSLWKTSELVRDATVRVQRAKMKKNWLIMVHFFVLSFLDTPLAAAVVSLVRLWMIWKKGAIYAGADNKLDWKFRLKIQFI